VHDLEQIAALRAAVERLLQAVLGVTSGNALENSSVFHW
jgi:hypothetical protein